jgi:hypothetical protein
MGKLTGRDAGRYRIWKIGKGAEGHVNRLVPRFAGLGKGLGPAQAGLQKKGFPTTFI